MLNVVFFSHIFEIFFSQYFPHNFYTEKEKNVIRKDFAVSQLATIIATRWTGNKLLFKGGLLGATLHDMESKVKG